MRILHVCSQMNRAGTETLLMNLYRNIDRDKVQFDFAVFSEKECIYDNEILHLGGVIYHYPRYTGINHFYFVKWWEDFFCTHPEYHIIHGHVGSTAALYLGVAKKHGLYTVAHSHNTTRINSIKALLYVLYSYPTRHIADYFFACSKQAMIDRYGTKIANNTMISSVLNNAIDVQQFVYNTALRKQVRDLLGLDESDFVLGTVGRLTRQKNPEMILDIVQRLIQDNVSVKMVWVGEGELEKYIRKEIQKKHLQDSFRLIGVRSDIPDILQSFDLFLFPSLFEGLGLACVEAQASGLPTLCSDQVPLDAKVSDSICFLPLNDIDAWIRRITEIRQSDYHSNRQKKDTCRQLADAGFDIKSVAKCLELFYLERDQKINET